MEDMERQLTRLEALSEELLEEGALKRIRADLESARAGYRETRLAVLALDLARQVKTCALASEDPDPGLLEALLILDIAEQHARRGVALVAGLVGGRGRET